MIGFIGCGNMAGAMIAGLKSKGIISSDSSIEKLNNAKKRYGIKITQSNIEVVKKSEIIVLATKPGDIETVLKEVKSEIRNKIIISIAAGIKIKKIVSVIGNKKIVRVMPNTPALVGEMAAGYSTNNLTKIEEIQVYNLLSKFGLAIKMDEDKLDYVTGLSGSGPAFIAHIIDSFAKAGADAGLDEATSYALTLKTFQGTTKLLIEKNMTPEQLINMVSSPNGTTVAGRSILEKSDVEKVINETVKKAVQRSFEMGK